MTVMKSRQQYVEEYHAAMKAERALWEKVEGHGPGQPGYDRELFNQWLEAVSRTNAASKALREAFASDK